MRFAALVALLASAGCDPRLYGEAEAKVESKPEPAKPTPEGDEPAAPPMSPLGALSMLSKSKEPGPFDEPLQSAAFKASAPYAAVLELRGRFVELDPQFSFSLEALTGGDSVSLRRVALRLRALADDKHVAAIVLRLGNVSLSMSVAEELRSILKTIGKPVHCHAERLDNTSMVVASACKRLVLEPTGELAVTGPALLPLYLKGLLDKLEVRADFLHVGAFKGAAEPLTRTEPSPEMRQTYTDLVDGAHARIVDAVADGRGLARDKVVELVDVGLFTADAARAAGLIDEVVTFTAFRDAASPGGAWKKVKVKEGQGGMDDLVGMLGLKPKRRVREPHVAILYAVGEVVEGRGGPGGAQGEIASSRLAPAVRAAADNDDVKAIVLRVDSPGGSALASEIIWQAVHEAAAKKPVVVSMGSLAASGGYYISTPATRIYAQPDTLTGSIGVVGGKIVIGAGLAKLGVRVEEIAHGKRALLYSPMRPWSADERAVVQASMEAIYTTFKARVAEGRHMKPEEVEPNAQGRVFTGAEALRRGLVDELGGLDEALAHAGELAKLPAGFPVDVYPGEPSLMDLFGGMAGVRAPAGLETALPLLPPRLAAALVDAVHLVQGFDRDRIRLVAFLPVLQ